MAAEMNPDVVDDMDELADDDLIEASLFWSLKIPASGTAEIEEPPIPNYIIHVTKACFGPKVTNGSRSVVMCGVEGDGEGNPKYTPICCLKANTMENVDLDLVFGEAAIFKIEGNKPCDVWLTGHLRPGFDTEPDIPDLPAEYYQGLAEDDEFEALDGEDSKLDDADDVGEDNDVEEDIEAPAQKKQKMNNGQPKVTAKANNNKNNNKKNKKSPKNKPVPSPQSNSNDNKNNNTKSKKKNKQSPKQKPASPATAPQEKEPQQQQQTQKDKQKKKKYKKKNMSGGMQFKEIREGSGSAIKKGDKVFVYYIGQLASDQSIFDKTLSGNGFSFTVGAGEVIKGWDMGLIGMKGEGSKRKLWIPPKLAYGNEAQEKIPANSTLLFTIEIKKVE